MLRELDIVLRNNNIESFLWSFNFYKFEDLDVVLVNIISQCEGRDIDDIYIRIFYREDSSYLRVFFLLELLYRESLEFRNRVAVDVDFYSLLSLNIRISFLEFFHHLSPHCETFLIEFSNLFFC